MRNLFSEIEVRWFRNTILITLGLVIVYVATHLLWGGTEIVYLSKEQLTAANTILKQDSSVNTLDTIRIQLNTYLTQILSSSQSPEAKRALVEQLNTLVIFPLADIPALLPTYPFYVKSPFWLVGHFVFFELIFWPLFGVIASVIYRASEAMGDGTFDEQKIPIHVAKAVYAPLSTIVIFLSIKVFSNDGSIVLDDLSSWIVVLAFILGFFSGRTVELLRRLKNVILPFGVYEQESVNDKSEGQQRIKQSFGNINGSLRFDSGLTIPDDFDHSDIVVNLYSANDLYFHQQREPGADGKFSIPGVPTGLYEIRAETEVGGTRYLATTVVDLGEAGVEVSLIFKAYSEYAYGMIIK